MTGKRTAILSILLALSLFSSSVALEIKASVDKQEIGVGDPVTLHVIITGRGGTLPEPTMPDLSGFEVYSSGRSQNISIINGAFTSSLDLNYVLVPKKVGEVIIGPIVVRDGSGMAATDPIKINVTQQAQPSQAPGGSSQAQRAPQPSRQPPQQSGDFFIDQAVDKTNPYIGEQLTLTFRFYQAVNLWDQPTLEWPKYSGVTVEDLTANHRYYEVVRGRRYLVTEIKRALFPISDGSVTIETPTLTIKADDFGVAFDPFGFFDRDLREAFKRGQPKALTTRPITLNVRPLPENGRPADFTGAVGKYSISAQVDKDSVGVDEPITLKLVLSGTGNIRSVPPIKLPDLPDFRIYDSGNTESMSNANNIISGTKTFEQAIIPKTSGIFTIPAISFSYFDPTRGAYRTESTSPILITATGEGLADVGGAPKNIIGAGKLSLGYIVTDFPENRKPVDLSRNFLFWFLQIVPAAAIVATVVHRSRTKRLLSDRGYARRTGASRRSRALFRKAATMKVKGDIAGFYGLLHDAVMGYVADKFNLEKSGMTIDQVRENVSIPENLRSELTSFLENCETARFAPGGTSPGNADGLLDRAGVLVGRLEKEI
jgi:hypothetical protein